MKKFILFFGIIIFILSLSCWYVISEKSLKDNNDRLINDSVLVTTDPILLKLENSFSMLGKMYNLKISETSGLDIRWKYKEGFYINNPNSPGLSIYVYGCNNGNELETKKLFKEISNVISKELNTVLSANDFKKDENNSYSDFSIYDGYAKEDVKLSFSANPECQSDSGSNLFSYVFSVGYTKEFDKNYQEQNSFLRDLKIKDAVVRILKKKGDFVLLAVNFDRGGNHIIAKKIDGKWQKVYQGQDRPSCDILERHAVPLEVFDAGCAETKG